MHLGVLHPLSIELFTFSYFCLNIQLRVSLNVYGFAYWFLKDPRGMGITAFDKIMILL